MYGLREDLYKRGRRVKRGGSRKAAAGTAAKARRKNGTIIMPKILGVLASWRENPRVWCRRLLVVSLALITIVSVIPYGSDAQTVLVASIGLDKIFHFMGFGCMAVFALGPEGIAEIGREWGFSIEHCYYRSYRSPKRRFIFI